MHCQTSLPFWVTASYKQLKLIIVEPCTDYARTLAIFVDGFTDVSTNFNDLNCKTILKPGVSLDHVRLKYNSSHLLP